MKKFEIIFYQNKSGRCFAEEFLDSLSGKEAQKVIWVLKLIEERMPLIGQYDFIPKQYFKKLQAYDGIWEVRASLSSNAFRLLGFLYDTEDILEFVITNGFRHKEDNIPDNETQTAQQRKKDYISRNKVSK